MLKDRWLSTLLWGSTRLVWASAGSSIDIARVSNLILIFLLIYFITILVLEDLSLDFLSDILRTCCFHIITKNISSHACDDGTTWILFWRHFLLLLSSTLAINLSSEDISDVSNAVIIQLEVAKVGLADAQKDTENLQDALLVLTGSEGLHCASDKIKLLL